MIQALLKPEVQQFIREHESDNPAQLMLQAKKFPHLPLKEIVEQIQARQKAKTKLPTWYHTQGIVFPPVLSMEQCSSEQTARYKAELVQGHRLIDLTGGSGVDTFYWSQSFQRVVYVEKEPHLVALARHNLKILGTSNIEVVEGLAEDYLQSITEKPDVIYLDPARRGKEGEKVISLADSVPDVLSIRDTLIQKAEQVIIKTSPLLDISQAISELTFVQQVHVVAVNNEVKEVLYILGQSKGDDPKITAMNIQANAVPQRFTFSLKEEQAQQFTLSLPLRYLYEPNKAILKAGAFKSISKKYGLHKLHANSHLYTSDHSINDFPGRVFKLKAIAPYKKRALKVLLPEGKANITVRNFPDSVKQIRKKTGLKEGGNKYLFATTDMESKLVILVAEKIEVMA